MKTYNFNKMMKKLNKFLSIFGVILFMSSCSNNDDTYYNYQMEEQVFNGSTLEYLKSQSKYDSMLVVLNRLPALKDSLSKSNMTLFALQNESFKSVINQINSIRAFNKKAPIYLKDFNVNELDTLMTRYIFNDYLDTKKIKVNSNGLELKGIKFGYVMHVDYETLNASGFVAGGPRRLKFSDTNNSLLLSKWISTYTDEVDVKTNTGVVHPLISGHDFGFDDFIFRLNK